jgi:hypothetical protein
MMDGTAALAFFSSRTERLLLHTNKYLIMASKNTPEDSTEKSIFPFTRVVESDNVGSQRCGDGSAAHV